MARTSTLEDRQNNHDRPSDARRYSKSSQASNAEEGQRLRGANQSPLHKLPAQAMNRKATRGLQDLRYSTDEGRHSSVHYVGSRSSPSFLTQDERNAMSTNLGGTTHSIPRNSTLSENDLPLNSADFVHRGSMLYGRSFDSVPQPSPASVMSLERLQEEATTNELISAEIKQLAADVDDAVILAILNGKITNAIIAYHEGTGYSMLGELTQVTMAAEQYNFSHIAARAQLWKAMILHEANETTHMAEILNDILRVIVHVEECTDADRYHMRRLVLLYGPYMWLRLTTSQDNVSPSEDAPIDLESPTTQQHMQTWARAVIKALEDRMGDEIGLWPTSEESLEAIGEGLRTESVVSNDLSSVFREQYEQLQNRNAQLEADVARYRAEREVYGELSTPNYPPSESHQVLAQGQESPWRQIRPASEDTNRGQTASNSMSHNLPGMAHNVGLQHTAPLPRRPLSKHINRSSSGDRRVLRVRNKTPGPSSISSRRASFSRSSGRRSRSSQSLNWRTGASLDQQRQNRDPRAEITVIERRGSNLRNMALAESLDGDEEEEESPKTVSHRRPSSMRQRSLVRGDERAPDRKQSAVILGTVANNRDSQLAGRYDNYPDLADDKYTRRRSSTLNPDAILRIDVEEHDMTGALSPTEIEHRYPKFAHHKEEERRKSETARRMPSSFDYPSYEALAKKLRDGGNPRRRPNGPRTEAKAVLAATEPSHVLRSNPTKVSALEPSISESGGVVRAPKRTHNIKFDFDHVQQTPHGSKRRSFQIPVESHSPTSRSRNIAPFTPESKSPASSAISVPRNVVGKTLTKSPQDYEFNRPIHESDDDSISALSSINPATSMRSLRDFQTLRSMTYSPDPMFRRLKLPSIQDLAPDDIGSSESTNQSQGSSQNPRLSTMLQQLQLAQSAQSRWRNQPEPYVRPLRRDSKPDISSPLRESWEAFAPPGPDYGRVGSYRPVKRRNINTTAEKSERTNSIYEEIGDQYPSPLEDNKDDGYETDIDGRKGRGRGRGLRIKT